MVNIEINTEVVLKCGCYFGLKPKDDSTDVVCGRVVRIENERNEFGETNRRKERLYIRTENNQILSIYTKDFYQKRVTFLNEDLQKKLDKELKAIQKAKEKAFKLKQVQTQSTNKDEVDTLVEDEQEITTINNINKIINSIKKPTKKTKTKVMEEK